MQAIEKSCSDIEQDQKAKPCEVCGDDPIAKMFCGACTLVEEESTLPAERSGAVLEVPNSSDNYAPPPLAGDHTPAVVLQREQTHHRAICLLAAQGLSNVEIAKALNLSPPTVAYTKKQPWAAKLICELQDQFGRKNVMRVLQDAAGGAARVLAGVATGAIPASPGVQIKAANELLDRLYGTARQNVHHTNGDVNDLTDEELAAEIRNSKTN